MWLFVLGKPDCIDMFMSQRLLGNYFPFATTDYICKNILWQKYKNILFNMSKVY